MKIYGGGNQDWGGWKENEEYPWYSLKFIDTQNVKQLVFKKLENDIPFSYIRLGDGPLGYVDDLKHRWHPKDEKIKQTFIENFEDIKSFDEDDFMIGMPFDTPEMSGGLISPINSLNQCWLSVEKYFDKNRKYFAHNFPHWMLCHEVKSFIEFTNLIKRKNVCIVGNERFPDNVLKFLYGNSVKHINVPYINAFYSHEKLTEEVLQQKDVDIFLFAASFATYPVMINVYKHVGNKITMIDIGSTIDPFVNYFANQNSSITITHSGRRGWWISDDPNISENFIKEISKKV